jgi:hypothetical protein
VAYWKAEKDMKIAILGWGSLLWEDRPEFDKQHDEPWQYDGPELKIEFSRISTSRQGALTLVLDEDNGSPMVVAWCLSKRKTVEDAICDLRCREGTVIRNIGCVRLPADISQPPEIGDWAREKNLDAAIWTRLPSNFGTETKKSFSVAAAVEYIKTLDACGKAKAAEYVWRAPGFVQTRVRNALQREPWFPKTTHPA